MQQNNVQGPQYQLFDKPLESTDMMPFLYRIISNWHWILFSVLLFTTLSWLYIRYTEPVYTAKASVMIRDEKKGASGVGVPILEEIIASKSSKNIDDEIVILGSYDLIENVVRKQKLYLTVKTKGTILNRTIFGTSIPIIFEVSNIDLLEKPIEWGFQYRGNNWQINYSETAAPLNITLGKWYIINGITIRAVANPEYSLLENPDLEKGEYLLEITPIKKAVTTYRKALSVSPTGKTGSIIVLELEDHNIDKAQATLAAIINTYNQQGLDDKNIVTSNTLDFLNERLALVERELRDVESKVQSFKSSNKVTNTSAEAIQYLEQVKDIDKQKAQQQTQLNILESLEKKLLENKNDPNLIPSGAGITDASLSELLAKHNQLVLDRERQLERLGPKNPISVDLGNQIASLRESLLNNISNVKQSYNIALRDIRSKDAQLAVQIRNIPQIEKNLVEIQRDQSVKEQLYFFLLQKREEAAITLASATIDSRTIERSRQDTIVSPKKTLVYALAVLLGLLLPIGIIYASSLLDNKIDGREEVERKCAAPLLGEISYVKKGSSGLVIEKNSRSIIAEQFRTLRTNIGLTAKGKSIRIISVTSHRPSEGKSFVTLNLAASFALLNKRIVVLEFDLRKPRLSQNLKIKSNAGISNYLSGNEKSVDNLLEEVTGYSGNFWLLPAGPIPPNPAELILSPLMTALLKDLQERFDYIVLDTPPFGPVTDSTLLAKHADMEIVILRDRYTFKNVLTELNRKVASGKPLYAILNRVGEKKAYGNYRQYGYTEYFDTPVKISRWKKLFRKG